MDKICKNCGKSGHEYKFCKYPVMSFGIILYCDKNIKGLNKTKIIMIERKDTLSYIEFLRGKYKSIYNTDYIQLLINRFSVNEKKKILNYEFDKLWEKLWIHTNTINNKIKREYSKSKEMFHQLRNGYEIKNMKYNLNYFIDNSDTNYIDNEWEIPKGRRLHNENNKECAIREFEEETNIDITNYQLIDNILPLIEEYISINDVHYKHIYYIGKIDNYLDLYIDKNNKDQYTEIKDIKWLTEEECYQKIRDYDNHKKKIIFEFFDFIKNYKLYSSLN